MTTFELMKIVSLPKTTIVTYAGEKMIACGVRHSTREIICEAKNGDVFFVSPQAVKSVEVTETKIHKIK